MMMKNLRLLSSPLSYKAIRALSVNKDQCRYKSVLVTGGSNGLGEGICRRLATDGYAITIADVDEERGQALAAEIGASYISVDVAVPAQLKVAVEKVVEVEGTLDALVNNAAVVGPQESYADYDVEEWKRIIDINLNGTFYGLKYGLAQMAKQKVTGGSIVNLCSVAGFRGYINLGPYTASKFAMRGMTQAAAVEFSSQGNIRVNAVAPTACETPMVKAFIKQSENPEELKASLTAVNAIQEFPQPSDVAAAVAFLLSDEARFITGHTLPVDAGLLSRTAAPIT